MNTEDIPSLILILVLLLFSALFSSSETSLFALDSVKLKTMHKRKGIKRIRQLLKQGSLLLIAILLGNTTVNIALTAVMEHTLAIENYIYSTIIVTAILLFFGEITPKTIAISRVEGVSIFTSKLLYPIYIILRPIARPIKAVSNLILKAMDKIFKPKNNSSVRDSHLTALLAMVSRGSFLDNDEKKLVESVLKFTSREVENIMTPRTKLISIRKTSPIKEAVKLAQKTKFSKIPVFDKTDDNIIGVIYLRDIFFYIHNPKEIKNQTVGDIMEKMYFVPETKKLSEMLEDFQTKKIRMAAVIDEYGSSLGIITISDVLGEIVGEIVDESFDIKKKIVRVNRKRFLVAGDIAIDDFNDYFKTKISGDEFDTLAGFAIEKVGDIPDEGQSIEVGKYIFTVRHRTINHIEKFIVERK